MTLLDNQEKEKVTLYLEKLSPQERVKDLLFYCKILQEPCAHSKSFRHLYALDYLKLAKEYLNGRMDWLELPIDIDNFILPILIASPKRNTKSRSDIDTSDLPPLKAHNTKIPKSGNLPFNPTVR